MSYEKITGTPNIISFYYTIDELFANDSVWTMYKAVNKIDEKGENLVDRLAITEDERDIFLSILSDGVFDVFNRFLKYTKGITDAILFNEDYTPSGGSAEKSTVVKIVDHESYNANRIKSVDKVLEKCLRFYVIKEWYSLKDLNDDAAKAEITYRQNINNLLRESMELKRPAITF